MPELDLPRAVPHRNETSRNLEVGTQVDELNGYPEPGTLAPSNGAVTPIKVHEADPAAARAPVPATRNRFALRTIGSLSLEVDGRNQIQRLRDQPRLVFLFSYLVARSVRARNMAVERSTIAEEMAPDIVPSSQRDRLRKTLHAFQAALGSDLKALVRVTATEVRLDLTPINADFVALAEMSAQVSRRHGLIEIAEDIRRLLETTAAGEFLADFSELEHQVTGGRGNAGQVVEEARSLISGWRADLTAALARNLEAAGRPQSSIVYLQSALSQSPQREDLARLLVAAYLQTGQTARAEEIRLEYELSSGEVR